MKDNGTIRVSKTGATRNSAIDKPEMTKYISALVVNEFCKYMLKHQIQSDGTKRSGDNWKKGFGETHKETKDICFDSLGRHFLDLWLEQEGHPSRDGMFEALGGLFFNVIAYWEAHIKEEQEVKVKRKE